VARAASGSVQVLGLNAVIRDLVAIGVEVEDLKDAFAKVAALGATIAAANVHSDSGALAADVRGNRAKSKAVITAGRASLPYAGVQNYGWPAHNISAQGFMQKADRELQPLALRLLEAEVNQQIRRRGMA
jgi:hypothetical protein